MCRSNSRLTVHTHIQLTIRPKRKTPRRLIKMIERDTKVGKYSVNFIHIQKTKKVFQKSKIALNQYKTGIFNYISESILILIKGNQPAILAQPLQYGTRVPPTPKRHIHIRTVRTNIQSV